MKKFTTILLLFSLSSCFSYKPIFDKQNSKYMSVGKAGADADFEDCKKLADNAFDEYKAERAAKEAGRKAVVGGVVGAASGLIFGGKLKSALVGTAIGAGAGAAIGGLSVYGEDKVKPDAMKQRYITNCLSKRGYSVLGWI